MVSINANVVEEYVDGGVVYVRLKRATEDVTILVPKHWVAATAVDTDTGDPTKGSS